MINLLEPVVAGVIGYFAGERLGISGYLGAALILASIFVVERGTHREASIARFTSPSRARHVTLTPARDAPGGSTSTAGP